MFRKVFILIFSFICISGFAQRNVNIPLASDFSIITTNNDTLNLFKTLSEGKTVVLDLFQVTCGPCQTNTPVIDSAFVLWGSGQNNVVFWGISNADSNNVINQFKATYNVHFPCAGIEGWGDSLINKLQTQLGVFGFPAYAVICPGDKAMHWQVNNQPTVHGFDNYINNCNASKIVQKKSTGDKLVQFFPNPTSDFININVKSDEEASFRVELLSNMGEKLRSQTYSTSQNGDNQFKLKLDGLKEGNYYLTVYQDWNLIYAGMVMKVNPK